MTRRPGPWSIAIASIGVFVVAPIVDPTTDPTAFLETVSAAVRPVRLGVWLHEAGR